MKAVTPKHSPDAQREACEAYIKSQAHEGWSLSLERYDDGGPLRRFIGAPLNLRPFHENRRKSPQARNAWLTTQSCANRSPRPSSLPAGKITGNFEKNGSSCEESSAKLTQNQLFRRQFPKILNRELFRANREWRAPKR